VDWHYTYPLVLTGMSVAAQHLVVEPMPQDYRNIWAELQKMISNENSF
jgi:hypothetical protein